MLFFIKGLVNRSRKLTLIFSILTTIIQVVISIGYVYVTLTSCIGLLLAIAIGFGNLFSSSVTLYNTLLEKKSINMELNSLSSSSQVESSIFLCFAIPSLLLTCASSFISSYTAMIFLGVALALPLSSGMLFNLSIITGVMTTISMFMYTALQTYEMWERIKTPESNELSILQMTLPHNTSPILQADAHLSRDFSPSVTQSTDEKKEAFKAVYCNKAYQQAQSNFGKSTYHAYQLFARPSRLRAHHQAYLPDIIKEDVVSLRRYSV